MQSIIIIGAGIAGPAAAVRLQQAGFQCTIYERSQEPKTIGGAVNIAPNGLRLLQRLNVGEQVKSKGCIVPAFELRNMKGQILGSFPNKSSDGLVGVRIMRSTLQRILLDEVRKCGVSINYGKTLQSILEWSDGVQAFFSDGTNARGDIIIGADGIHSVVRKYVSSPEEKEAEYTGVSLVYGMVDCEKLDPDMVASLAPTSGVFGLNAFFAAAFSNNERTRLYWVSSTQKAVAERLSDPDVIRTQELQRFSNFYQPIPEMISKTDEFFSWPIYELPTLSHWYKGDVVLVGDSAHALPPDRGQGVSQALEDVFILARVLEAGKPLDRYEALRKPRVERLRETIKRDKKDRHLGPWAGWFRDWGFWIFLKLLAILTVWFTPPEFSYDPDKVSI